MRYICALFAVVLYSVSAVSAQTPPPAGAPRPPGLLLSSRGFTDGGILPDKYSQAVAAPVSPPLAWANVPPGTVSFILFPALSGSCRIKMTADTLHWLAFNIPGTATGLPEGVATVAQ